jgi:hypothetical protein
MSIATLEAELARVTSKLSSLRQAEDMVIRGGQRFTIDDGDMVRTITRADAKWLSSQILYYEEREKKIQYELLNNGNTGRSGIYVGIM